ncbi:hypothetical protein P3W45_000257 [Vairimorpha bombi]|jgi:hypothetical protein
MRTLLYFLIADLTLLIVYQYPSGSYQKLDLSDVLQILEIDNHKFPEYSLLFVVYLGIIPIGIICLTLISFKLYTHDFVKPIQRSYMMAVVSYISSIMFNIYATDFLLHFTAQMSFSKLSTDLDYCYVFKIFSRLVSLLLNVIFFIFTFLLLEVQIAFNLNSIPLSNIYILKKNNKCLILVLVSVLAYLLIFIRFMIPIYKYVNSLLNILYMINISLISVLLNNIFFYFVYLTYTTSYILENSRVHREFPE